MSNKNKKDSNIKTAVTILIVVAVLGLLLISGMMGGGDMSADSGHGHAH